MTVSTDRWTCPRCQRPTVVSGSEKDVAAALDAVRARHAEGHGAGRHDLDTPPGNVSPRGESRARRAEGRAAARRRRNRRAA